MQYRSLYYYYDDEQKQLAKKYKRNIDKSGAWDNPIVTEVSTLTSFFEAEGYHQDYYENNPSRGYCAFVIAPKVEKFERVFRNKLKKPE